MTSRKKKTHFFQQMRTISLKKSSLHPSRCSNHQDSSLILPCSSLTALNHEFLEMLLICSGKWQGVAVSFIGSAKLLDCYLALVFLDRFGAGTASCQLDSTGLFSPWESAAIHEDNNSTWEQGIIFSADNTA